MSLPLRDRVGLTAAQRQARVARASYRDSGEISTLREISDREISLDLLVHIARDLRSRSLEITKEFAITLNGVDVAPSVVPAVLDPRCS